MGLVDANAAEAEPLELGSVGALGELILPELPGCDDLTVRKQLSWALREFCRETDACVVAAPAQAVSDINLWGVRLALPAAPEGMVVGTVLEVTVGGEPVDFEVRRELPQPHIYTNAYIGKGETAIVRFSVYPKAGGERCPAWFLDRYAEAVAAGAMHALLSMSKRPWADAARAAEYGAKYADAVNEAAYRARGAAEHGGAESAVPCGGIFM